MGDGIAVEWKKEEIRYQSATGMGDIHAVVYKPQGQVRLVVQIAHGMAEHIERYDAFAAFLAEQGIACALNDHAGHGKSIQDKANTGYFAPQDGWGAVLSDMKTLHDTAMQVYPGIPYVLMGHSMGSFLARAYAVRYPDDMDAFVFSGTGGKNNAVGMGKLVARREIKKNGPKVPSVLLNNLSFGSYNKAFSPARTPSDWLSRDERMVDAYVADPLCGFCFTGEAMLDFLGGMQEVTGIGWARQVPDKPIYIFSGDKDPVGGNGKGVMQVCGWLKETGHTVLCKMYEAGRHEMLNETNRQEVFLDVLGFFNTIARSSGEE